jgi:hypothetical protein
MDMSILSASEDSDNSDGEQPAVSYPALVTSDGSKDLGGGRRGSKRYLSPDFDCNRTHCGHWERGLFQIARQPISELTNS